MKKNNGIINSFEIYGINFNIMYASCLALKSLSVSINMSRPFKIIAAITGIFTSNKVL